MYVDDIMTYEVISASADREALQKAIVSVVEWPNRMEMPLTAEKTVAFRIDNCHTAETIYNFL